MKAGNEMTKYEIENRGRGQASIAEDRDLKKK